MEGAAGRGRTGWIRLDGGFCLGGRREWWVSMPSILHTYKRSQSEPFSEIKIIKSIHRPSVSYTGTSDKQGPLAVSVSTANILTGGNYKLTVRTDCTWDGSCPQTNRAFFSFGAVKAGTEIVNVSAASRLLYIRAWLLAKR